MTSVAKVRDTPYLTSSHVTGEPSCHFMPLRSVNFQSLPPFIGVPVSVAMSGTSVLASLASRLTL
jgi:hypothetical protein